MGIQIMNPSVVSGGGVFEKIAEVILASPTATVTFSSIPNKYHKLECLMYVWNNSNTLGVYSEIQARINGLTSSRYKYKAGYTGADSLTAMGFNDRFRLGNSTVPDNYNKVAPLAVRLELSAEKMFGAGFYYEMRAQQPYEINDVAQGHISTGLYDDNDTQTQNFIHRVDLFMNNYSFVAGSRFILLGVKK